MENDGLLQCLHDPVHGPLLFPTSHPITVRFSSFMQRKEAETRSVRSSYSTRTTPEATPTTFSEFSLPFPLISMVAVRNSPPSPCESPVLQITAPPQFSQPNTSTAALRRSTVAAVWTCPWAQSPQGGAPLGPCPAQHLHSSSSTMTQTRLPERPVPEGLHESGAEMWDTQGQTGLHICEAIFLFVSHFTNRLWKELESKVQGCNLWREYEVQIFYIEQGFDNQHDKDVLSHYSGIKVLEFSTIMNRPSSASPGWFWLLPQELIYYDLFFRNTIFIIICKSFKCRITVSSPTSLFYQNPEDFHPELHYTPC